MFVGNIVDSFLIGGVKRCLMSSLVMKFSEGFVVPTLADLLCPEWMREMASDFLFSEGVFSLFTRSFVTLMFSFGYFFRFSSVFGSSYLCRKAMNDKKISLLSIKMFPTIFRSWYLSRGVQCHFRASSAGPERMG